MKNRIISLISVVVLIFMVLPAVNPSPMLAAAPSVLSVTETEFGSDTQVHDVDMPGTVDAGDLLIVLFSNDDDDSVTTPTGWTLLETEERNGQTRLSVYYKIAVGDEDGDTVNFETSGDERAAAQVYRISNSSWHGTTPPEISTAATGNSNSPDPASLDPTAWGTEDTLWIAVAGLNNDYSAITYPTSYTDGVSTQGVTSGSGDCQVSSARRVNTTASEDPGTFGISQSDDWVAFTIAIRPAPAGPGITVNPTSGLATTEAGGTDSFTVVLNTEPSADVTVGISSDDTSEGTVLPTSLNFTSLNWSTAQTVTVTGEDDDVDDGDIPYNIATAAAVSGDGDYNGINPADVSVTNHDDDTAGVTIAETAGSTDVDEEGPTSDTYSVVLDSEPTNNVVISVTPDAQVTVAPAALTFGSGNWSTAQDVTVTAVDDAVIEWAHTGTITHSASSGDAKYDGISIDDVIANIADNDGADIAIQLAMILDGSGSIDSDDWSIIKNGLAAAIDGGVLCSQRSATNNTGAFSDPTNAYADGGDYATATDGQVHQYYDYDFAIPDGATINGIEVRLDAWRQRNTSASVSVELSWDGGGNWTSTGYSESLSYSTSNVEYYGGASDDWGHGWTASEVNTGLRVRLTVTATGWVRLDWVPVTVCYQSEGCVPLDGSVELTVIQFSDDAELEVGPVVLTGANAADVAADIRNILQMDDYTCISCGICLAADTLAGSPCFDASIKQAINIVTDGVPNLCSECNEEYEGDDCFPGGGSCSSSGCPEAYASAEAARNYALSLLGMDTDPQDEFDAEFIGSQGAESDWLKDEIVWPEQLDGNGYYAPPFDKGPGWVRVVTTFTEFAETICEKFEIVLYGSITAHKFNDLNGDGDQDGGEDNLSGWTMTLYSGSDCSGTPLGSDETNASGNVVFTGLEAGTYSVKETPKDGWTNSTALCQQVTIDAGESATLNFGNLFCILPTAAFSATPTSCCAPLTVTFTDQSTGNPTSWSWDFGDGNNSTDKNPPPHQYANAGTYNVTLTVSNACGSDDETKAEYITANQGPTADFSADVQSCCAPLEVTFSDNSTAGDHSIISWEWDLDGDGVYETSGQGPHSKTYAAGTYSVSLNVTDSHGCWDVETKEGYITANEGPEADFSADVMDCCAPLEVTFSDNSTAGDHSIISWEWDLDGDGVYETSGQGPHSKTYAAGTYSVSLNVTDSHGCWDVETKEGYITANEGPDADFSADVTICSLEVQFTDESIAGDHDIVSWSWDFGDGDTSIEQNPIHTYDAAGTYNVTLTVTDEHGCIDSETKAVTVYGKPTATASSNSPVPQGATIQLYGGPGGMASYSWTGPNSFNSTERNPTIPNATIAMTGTYTLTVISEHGCTDDATTYVRVTVPPLPPTGGGGGCPSTKYLTVDWEGEITDERLYSNDKLAADLLGPSPDGSHSLLLERGTHAPVVGGTTYYLIVIRELEEIPPPPENTVAIVVFNITPADAVFDRDIFLTLGLDELQLPENALNITMSYYDDIDGVWVPLEYEAGGPPNSVAELSLSAPINHFSIFGVLAEIEPTPPPQPAHFVASGLSIEPSVEKIWKSVTFVTKTGESVTITANVANDGGQEGEWTVELKLNGETVDTEIGTLGAGQSKQVSFTVSELDYGQYEVEVAGLSGNFTTARTITWWLIILIIAAIGLIIWGVVWGRRRRRRAAQEG